MYENILTTRSGHFVSILFCGWNLHTDTGFLGAEGRWFRIGGPRIVFDRNGIFLWFDALVDRREVLLEAG
jgi:hypothetical protein